MDKKAEAEARKKAKADQKNSEIRQELDRVKKLEGSSDHLSAVTEILNCSPWKSTEEDVKRAFAAVFHKRLLDAKVDNIEKIIGQLDSEQSAIIYLFILKCLELIKAGNSIFFLLETKSRVWELENRREI